MVLQVPPHGRAAGRLSAAARSTCRRCVRLGWEVERETLCAVVADLPSASAHSTTGRFTRPSARRRKPPPRSASWTRAVRWSHCQRLHGARAVAGSRRMRHREGVATSTVQADRNRLSLSSAARVSAWGSAPRPADDNRQGVTRLARPTVERCLETVPSPPSTRSAAGATAGRGRRCAGGSRALRPASGRRVPRTSGGPAPAAARSPSADPATPRSRPPR